MLDSSTVHFDIEICNPLGTAAGIHSRQLYLYHNYLLLLLTIIQVFYYILGNIRPLLAIAKSKDVDGQKLLAYSSFWIRS